MKSQDETIERVWFAMHQATGSNLARWSCLFGHHSSGPLESRPLGLHVP